MRLLLATLLIPALAGTLFAAGRPITVDDLLAVKGVSDPQVSPDGKFVAYVVSEIDRATDKSNADIYLVATAGGEPRRLTTSPGADNHPRWSPDGQQIAFTSTRGGSSQVWLLPLAGGEARQLTKLPVDASGPIWSPRGDAIAFVAEVYPGKTPEETAKLDKEKEGSKTKARTYDSLMIRHWMSWDEGKRSHLFLADAATGASRDLTPKLDANTPPAPFGGSSDYAFSADGATLAFTAEPAKDLAWSTNTDIWTVPAAGGTLTNLTAANLGADAQPAFSPDGKSLAYVSQARAGFESDLWVMKVIDLASRRTYDASSSFDRPIQSFAWRRDGLIVVTVDDNGTEPIDVIDPYAALHGGAARLAPVITGGVNTAGQPLPDNSAIVYSHASATHPAEVYIKTSSSPSIALTHHNDALVSGLDLSAAEGFQFPGADGDKVSGWLVKPPGFDASKKYPVLFLIHGGPQGAWHDEWSARWNYQMFASPGYVVVAVNPRGSTGYGQKFTDQISGDWTGRVYEDLKKGLDYALNAYPFLDSSKMAAAGGSYGGFMVNWIAGHDDRFKCLISHAGVFDLTSKYGTTEELWFPEWEFGGTPWDKPEIYRAMSPSGFVKNFKTPTLVIHGALDFRVPEAQGLGMFTSLQRVGVPSRYLWFPDEGHWILKPQNRIVWWNEMYSWLDKYLKH